MRILAVAAIWLITMTAAHAQNDLSDIENQAIEEMVGCYQAHKIHELVGRMNEDEFVRTVMTEVCMEKRKQAAQTLADALASKGISQDDIPDRVQSFLLGHTTFLRMFYRRIKGAK
jgi:hypothetical protein